MEEFSNLIKDMRLLDPQLVGGTFSSRETITELLLELIEFLYLKNGMPNLEIFIKFFYRGLVLTIAQYHYNVVFEITSCFSSLIIGDYQCNQLLLELKALWSDLENGGLILSLQQCYYIM